MPVGSKKLTRVKLLSARTGHVTKFNRKTGTHELISEFAQSVGPLCILIGPARYCLDRIQASTSSRNQNWQRPDCLTSSGSGKSS